MAFPDDIGAPPAAIDPAPTRLDADTFAERSDALAAWYIPFRAYLASLRTYLLAFITELGVVQADVADKQDQADDSATAAAASAVTAAAAAASATGAADVSGTSTTVRTPTVGSQTWVYVETGKVPYAGMRMRAASRAALTTNYALGTVASYDAGTRTLSLTVDQVGAAPASASDWNLVLEGEPGPPGEDAEVDMPVLLFAGSGTLSSDNTTRGRIIHCTGTFTVGSDTTAAHGDGYSNVVVNTGTGNVTLPGGTVLLPGQSALLYTDGATWSARVITGTGLMPLGKVTFSAASVALVNGVFTANYDRYLILGSDITFSNDTAGLRARLELGGSVISTSTYDELSTGQLQGVSWSSGSGTSGTSISLLPSWSENATDASLSLAIEVDCPASTTRAKRITWRAEMGHATTPAGAYQTGLGVNTGTAALTGVQIYPTAGTISGTLRVYGYLNQ